MGGQLWLSNGAPGDISDEDSHYESFVTHEEKYIDKNYIEFNDSDIFMRIPKEISKLIYVEPGTFKKVKDVIKEIKEKEKNM